MPYSGEHACRVREPGEFQSDSFRRIDGKADNKPISLIVGRLKGEESTTLQSFRYPKEAWTPTEARGHCNRNGGKAFESAKGEEMMESQTLRELENTLRQAEVRALVDHKTGKADAPILYKAQGFVKDTKTPMIFVASEETPDRFGDVISIDGWDTKEFEKNPVFMFTHDYSVAPLGSVAKVWKDGKQLLAAVQWDEADPFALFVKGKYERNFMRAVSVGFRPLDYEKTDKGFRFVKAELLEVSAVPIPAHPAALKKAMAGRRFGSLGPEQFKDLPVWRGAISYQSAHPNGTPASARDAQWDAGAEMQAASVDDLKVMCAWVDYEHDDIKQGYKFPHHKASGDHPVNFRALAAIVAVLNGARGGANIPDEDRRGVYNHIARHFRDDFDAEAPELRSGEDLLRFKAQVERLIEGGPDSLALLVASVSKQEVAATSYTEVAARISHLKKAILQDGGGKDD